MVLKSTGQGHIALVILQILTNIIYRYYGIRYIWYLKIRYDIFDIYDINCYLYPQFISSGQMTYWYILLTHLFIIYILDGLFIFGFFFLNNVPAKSSYLEIYAQILISANLLSKSVGIRSIYP